MFYRLRVFLYALYYRLWVRQLYKNDGGEPVDIDWDLALTLAEINVGVDAYW